MKRYIVIVVLIAGVIFSNTKVKSQNISEGLRYIELGQMKKAYSYFDKIVKQNPNNTQAWLRLGDISIMKNNPDSALYFYNKGLSVNANDVYNLAGAAKAYYLKGDAATAEQNIQKALKLIKGVKDADFYIYLANVYKAGEKFESGLQALDKARDINKTNPEIYITKGDIFMEMPDKAGEAANEYDKALYYNKNYARAYYEIGKLYVLAWNYEEARKAFLNVIKIDSNYIPVYKDLAELYYRANKNELAANEYAKYIAKAEIKLTDIARYAQMLYFSKNYAKSSEVIDRYLKRDSSNFVLLRLKGYNSYELKDYPTGLKAMDKMFSLVNNENRLITTDYEYYGKFLAVDKKDSLAIVNWEAALKMDSTKTYLYEDIAKSYENLNNYKKAIESYENLIKTSKVKQINDYYLLGKSSYILISDPVNPVDTTTKRIYAQKADSAFSVLIEQLPEQHLGYIYKARVASVLDAEAEKGLAKPWYEQAITVMEKTPEKFKRELVEAQEYLGFYYFIKKDYDTSEQHWKKILSIDPDNSKAKEAIKGINKMKLKSKSR